MPSAVMTRFLAPRYVHRDGAEAVWQAGDVVETPAADARCRIFVRSGADGRLAAVFSAFGPPVVIAAVDWLCEHVSRMPSSSADMPTSKDIEHALEFRPEQRYAALLATDALAKALANLGS